MRMMTATGLIFVAISHSVSFMGKVWLLLLLLLRLLVLLLAGFSLFSDEQERFVCNTIQPGCSNVCFDVFAPVSVLRLWLLHLLLLCLPHLTFATYVAHRVSSGPRLLGALPWGRTRGGSPSLSLETSSSSRELSLHKELQREWGTPRFYGAYLLVVLLRILLEVIFGAGQFLLFGLSMPKSFLCYEAPCTSGVECYISRPSEKTLMLNFMLGVASLSVLLSLADLVSSAKALVRWRRRRQEVFMEEMSKGEQSSVFTATTTTEDGDAAPCTREEKHGAPVLQNGEAPHAKALKPAGSTNNEEKLDTKDLKTEVPTTPVPTHHVLHSHLRPPLSPRPPTSRVTTPMGVKKFGHQTQTGAGEASGQTSDSSEGQEKRAWV